MQQISFLPGEMTPGERSHILRALKTLDRHLHEPGVAFTSTRAAREWLILNMAGLEREEFRVLYLNNQNQLIAGETLFTGTINRTEVHPREVIKRALYHNAAAVVLAHNHPSGEVTPSKADRLITERLVQALGLVDIRVPDHLIVGGSQVFSFAEHGCFIFWGKTVQCWQSNSLTKQSVQNDCPCRFRNSFFKGKQHEN